MIKEDGSTSVSFPLVTFLGGGEGGVDSCQTMNFVLLMLLGVNRVNAAAHPELQIRGGGGAGGAGPYPRSATGVCLPFDAWFSEVYCCCRCCNCLFVFFCCCGFFSKFKVKSKS